MNEDTSNRGQRDGQSPPALSYDCAWVTDRGKVRPNNEDWADIQPVGDSRIMVLADGMARHRGGEVAAEIAVESVTRVFTETPPEGDAERRMEALIESFRIAHGEIERRIAEAEDGHLFGMGCTVVAVLLGPHDAVYQYAGDSRFYWIRDGQVRHVSKDHSVVRVLIDLGHVKPEDAERHPMAGQLTSSLGGNGNWERVQVSPAFHEAVITPLPGDVILLCSDGVYTELSDERIGQLAGAGAGADAKERVDAMKTALEAGSARDNFTIALAVVKADSGGAVEASGDAVDDEVNDEEEL